MQTFSLLNKTRAKVPAVPFRKIKDSVLGRSYELLNDIKEAIYFYQSAMRKEGRFRDSADRVAALQKK